MQEGIQTDFARQENTRALSTGNYQLIVDELALFLLNLPSLSERFRYYESMSVFLSNESLMNNTTIECFPPVLEVLQIEEISTKCFLLKVWAISAFLI